MRIFLVGLPLGLFITGVIAMWLYYNKPNGGADDHVLRRGVNAADLEQYAAVLSRIGDRDLSRPAALERTWKFIKSSMGEQNMGYVVQTRVFPVGEVKCVNLRVEVPGERSPDDVILVVANYDGSSVGGSVSGTAGLMSLAHAFIGTEPWRTIRFVALANEESGEKPSGSEVLARQIAANADERVVQMFYLTDREIEGTAEAFSVADGESAVKKLEKTIAALASGRMRLE